MSLDDVTETEAGLPPGLGRLDFRAAAAWKARTIDVAIDVEPLADVHLLRFAADQLRTLGFS
jgi:hypothetical protein